MNTHEIILSPDPTGKFWTATFCGPLGATMADLYGTETIPTAWTTEASADEVIAYVARRNPEYRVRVAAPDERLPA